AFYGADDGGQLCVSILGPMRLATTGDKCAVHGHGTRCGGPTLTVNGSSTPITVAAGSTITVVARNLAANDSNIVALFITGTANSQSLKGLPDWQSDDA